jgi:hypothetical protein
MDRLALGGLAVLDDQGDFHGVSSWGDRQATPFDVNFAGPALGGFGIKKTA